MIEYSTWLMRWYGNVVLDGRNLTDGVICSTGNGSGNAGLCGRVLVLLPAFFTSCMRSAIPPASFSGEDVKRPFAVWTSSRSLLVSNTWRGGTIPGALSRWCHLWVRGAARPAVRGDRRQGVAWVSVAGCFSGLDEGNHVRNGSCQNTISTLAPPGGCPYQRSHLAGHRE